MPGEAFKWMGRIKAVEREYKAIRFSTDRLLAALDTDSAILAGEVERHDVATAAANLEATYIIRVFSEFESGLQHFVRAFRIARPRGAEALVNRVAVRGRIPHDQTDAVHLVRELRNLLVHEHARRVARLSIRQATSSLCTFLSRVQRIW